MRRVIPFDKRGSERGVGGLWRMARAIRSAGGSAVAYLAQGSLRSAALAALGGYRERVGFDTSDGRALYTRRIRYRADQHHAERLLRLALGAEAVIDAHVLRPRLFPSDEDRTIVDRILDAGDSREPMIVLAPGSVWATKRWPGFPALASQLRAQARIAIVGGGDDRELARTIVEVVPDAIDTTGRLSLLQSAELIGRAALLVTNDSLPQHLASAMNTRTLTIFGPTIPGFGFGPLAAHSLTVGHSTLTCRPCHPHGPAVCPLGHHLCMRDLSEEIVLSKALKVLAA